MGRVQNTAKTFLKIVKIFLVFFFFLIFIYDFIVYAIICLAIIWQKKEIQLTVGQQFVPAQQQRGGGRSTPGEKSFISSEI